MREGKSERSGVDRDWLVCPVYVRLYVKIKLPFHKRGALAVVRGNGSIGGSSENLVDVLALANWKYLN